MGQFNKLFFIKPEFCTRENEILRATRTPYIFLKPNAEAAGFLRTIKALSMGLQDNAALSEEENTRCASIPLGNISKKIPLQLESTSQPTVIIAPGSGIDFPAYKGLVHCQL